MASIQKNVQELKQALDTDKVIIGTDRTIKSLKQGNIVRIYLSENVSNDIKDDLEHYAKLSDVEIIELPYPNDEFGTVCKKPFAISVVGILR